MHIRSLRGSFSAGRLFSSLTIGAFAVLVTLDYPSATARAQAAERRMDSISRPLFREPVTLTSKNGVLEVRLTARQGQATLDTVAVPVQNFLLFDYELIRGEASDGQRSGGNLYPGPTLQVFPGERLIIHFENGLTGLTIRDYFSPQYTPQGQPVPIYLEQMTSSPINLHTHGLHISPKGNADNVLLHIPPIQQKRSRGDQPPALIIPCTTTATTAVMRIAHNTNVVVSATKMVGRCITVRCLGRVPQNRSKSAGYRFPRGGQTIESNTSGREKLELDQVESGVPCLFK